MPANYSKNIVYLSKEQYQELITNETLTVNGQTIEYNDNDIYVTPQEEPYIKPASGIPASDLASGVIPAVPVQDVQVNGTSILNNGVANVPLASTNTPGVVIVGSGLRVSAANKLLVNYSGSEKVKAGTETYQPLVPYIQHEATFYGLAKAAGADMASSSNAVGTYTDSAKAAIKSMLGIVDGSTGTVSVSGTTPTITAVENTRYVCGEVATLSFTPPASGISIVRFTSGTTATVLTLPNTVIFPEWFDATALEANTIYEMCITDGIYGAVMSWT